VTFNYDLHCSKAVSHDRRDRVKKRHLTHPVGGVVAERPNPVTDDPELAARKQSLMSAAASGKRDMLLCHAILEGGADDPLES
jgi:hypothetical protein